MKTTIKKIKMLHIPKGYNEQTILEWVNPQDHECEVLHEFVNEYNYCLFVKESWGEEPEYRFYRIFLVGGKTHLSVDYDSTQVPLSDALAKFLNDKAK